MLLGISALSQRLNVLGDRAHAQNTAVATSVCITTDGGYRRNYSKVESIAALSKDGSGKNTSKLTPESYNLNTNIGNMFLET